MKNILVTGTCGFIGFHLTLKLLKKKINVIGIDNMDDYYDVNLKIDRLKILKQYKNFKFFKENILNKKKLRNIFSKNKFNYVCHLAAQAGVRFSISNPQKYIDTNISGFQNILDLSNQFKIKHLLFASSSSVYGINKQKELDESKPTEHPISVYAATKKSNEMFAHVYSSLFNLPTTGLRFFTVYGPYGRPDMSLYTFSSLIRENKKISLFNKGKMGRSFTYIDDVVEIIIKLVKKIPKKTKFKKLKTNYSNCPFRLVNVGNPKKYSLKQYVKIIEKNLSKKALIKLESMQLGDVRETTASIKNLNKLMDKKKFTSLETGIKKYINWFNARKN